jgi:methyl-CpG-binding domain protein 4
MVSPFNTLQEQQIGRPHAPWRVLVACTLLNQTHGRQVRPMIDRLFEAWPTPRQLSLIPTEGADVEDLKDLLRPLGFANRRSANLITMSTQYDGLEIVGGEDFWRAEEFVLSPDPARWVVGLTGCGQYAIDSVKIFVYGKLENTSSDTWLQRYVDWRREQA